MVCPGCVYVKEIVLTFVSFCFIVYDHLNQMLTTAGSENICKINPESADTQHRMWLISQVYCFFVKDVRLRVAVTSLTAENSAWPMRINMATKFARGGVGRGRVSVTSERSRNWLNVGIKIYCWLKWVNGQR